MVQILISDHLNTKFYHQLIYLPNRLPTILHCPSLG